MGRAGLPGAGGAVLTGATARRPAPRVPPLILPSRLLRPDPAVFPTALLCVPQKNKMRSHAETRTIRTNKKTQGHGGMHKKLVILSMTAVAAGAPGTALAQNQDPGQPLVLPRLEVSDTAAEPGSEQTGAYAVPSTRTATRLDLTPRETPQAFSVITRQMIEDFQLNNINDALEMTPAVTVERVETDRTYYTARGFDITNFQYDGIGSPVPYGLVDGDIDTATYDRIEVVRGANGLISPMGDPSATVNFVRKRPTRELQAEVDITVGSWETYRLAGDVSGPVNDKLRGRLVIARQDKDSYLDRYHHAKTIVYGVIEGDLSRNGSLSFGHTYQDNQADSPMWGALPLVYSDGTPTDYDVSTSTATDWSYWDGQHHISFLEYAHRFAGGWQGKAVLTRRAFDEDSKLFYLYGQPDAADPDTGLFVYPSRYESQTEELAADVYAAGPFSAFGREHQLVVGAGWVRLQHDALSNYGQGIGDPFPHDLADWDGDYPEPAFDAAADGADWSDRFLSLYSTAHLNLLDRLSSVVGARLTRVETEGSSYGADFEKESGPRLVPYLGLIYELSQRHSLYGSVTEIFRPQAELGTDRTPLDPAEGRSLEAGIKSEFSAGDLNTTLAVFRTRQEGLAEVVGYDGATPLHAPADYDSQGIELEAAGRLLDRLLLSGGYTYVDIDDDAGDRTRTYVPRHLLRLSARYSLTEKLSLGAGLNWQSETHAEYGGARIEQDAYALLRLMARYRFADNLDLALNVNNVTDQKYLGSLRWGGDSGQGFYGAPRNASLTLTWNY